jgi:flagellar assembly protein FliH
MRSSSASRAVLSRQPPATRASLWSPSDLGPARAIEPVASSSAADLTSEAYALGFEEGRREGELAEQARLRTTIRAAEEALEIIAANEARWSGAIEENISALAVAVARHIIDREVAADPLLLPALVRRALNEFPLDQSVRIRVNPGDLAIITSLSEQRPASAFDSPKRDAHWVADARIATGGCVAEGRDRIIDGRIDTALERVYRRLTYQHA